MKFPQLGPYRIEKEIGRGGMGTVYKADDLEKNVRVAIKVLRRISGSKLLRFKNEFRALHDIEHENLI